VSHFQLHFLQPLVVYFLSPNTLRSYSIFSTPWTFVTQAVPLIKSHSSAKHVALYVSWQENMN